MKVLFITTFSWSPHLEVSGEIALTLAKNGDEVIYHIVFTKNHEEYPSIKNLFLALKRYLNLYLILRNKVKFNLSINLFNSNKGSFSKEIRLNDIINYKYKQAEIGLGVASSLNDLINNNRITENELNQFANKMINSAKKIFNISIKSIKKNQPHVLYTFNPRFANTRPIYEAAKILKININTYEVPIDINKYSISKYSIFDGYNVSKDMKIFWIKGCKEKEKIAKSYYIGLKKVFFANSYNINSNFRINDFFDNNKINIIFFPSSIHETYALGDLYPHSIFESQIEALNYLVELALSNKNINLILRLHPILKQKSKEEQQFWTKYQSIKHIKTISYEDDVSSYDLIEKSDKIIVYHSTIGIEAAYYKKEVMAIGTPWWVGLKCIFHPSNKSEISDYIFSKIEYEYDFSESLIFAYYYLENGIPFNYFKPIDRYSGLFCGQDLNKLTSK
jgi:hypothetical protein